MGPLPQMNRRGEIYRMSPTGPRHVGLTLKELVFPGEGKAPLAFPHRPILWS